MRSPRFVRRGEMQVVQQQDGPINVQNPSIIRLRQNHFDAVHTSFRRQRTSAGFALLNAVPDQQWSATEDSRQLRPSTSATQQQSPQLTVEVARRQQSPEHQQGSPSLVRMSGERVSGQMSMLAEDMENLLSPEKKRSRPAKSSPSRGSAFERQQREKTEKKKRWSEMMAAEGRRLLQQAEEVQQCEWDRQAAEHQQLEAKKRRQQLQQRRVRITQLWETQLRASPTPTSFSAPNVCTARPSPPQSPASKGKGQGSATETVQEQSLDAYESATAGLSRAQLKRLPYTVAGKPSGDCCIC